MTAAIGLHAGAEPLTSSEMSGSGPAPASLPKKVFAHVMINSVAYPPCPPSYEHRAPAYKREILEAQARGIEGFVINVGLWDAHHKALCDSMYQAAKDANSGFKLFFSIDYNYTTQFDTGQPPGAEEAAVEIVTRYKDHPCHFHWNGKPVVSTFFGSQKPRDYWESAFFRPLRDKGVDIFFVPNFYRHNNAREVLSDEAFVQGIYEDYPFVDGLFYFGGAAVPADIVSSNHTHAKVARGMAKLYMACVSPTYSPRGYRTDGFNNNRLFDYRGGEGLCEIWRGIIEDQPPWVEIVTWNDYPEQHYIGPSESNIDDARRFPHIAYLELCEYFLKWYKTGVQPPITQDKALYFYRSHSKNAEAPRARIPKPLNWDTVSDSIYVTTMLTAPATLEIETGDEMQRYDLAAGMQSVSRPFKEGTQRVRLIRDGKVIAESTGELPISNAITKYNFNYYSAVATSSVG